jgi:hypothetical protein
MFINISIIDFDLSLANIIKVKEVINGFLLYSSTLNNSV